jgi:putative hydrolase of the HAD superfamily
VPQAILFDLDDTIIYWPTPPEADWETVVNRFAGEADGLKPEKLLGAINHTRTWYWKDLERHRLGRLDLRVARREVVHLSLKRLDIDNPALAGKIADTFTAEREKNEALVPGAIATLKQLRKLGIKLALITNGGSEMQRGKINKFQLAPYFENILVEGEFGCGKPDERVFHHTLGKLNVLPAEAWMVGDDLGRDISACRTLGIFSVWVNGTTDEPQDINARPDKIIKSIAEIPGLL